MKNDKLNADHLKNVIKILNDSPVDDDSTAPDSIKTPEEIAKELVMKVMRWEGITQMQFDTAEKQKLFNENLDHLCLSFIELFNELSAERNANLEKIKELEKQVADLKFFDIGNLKAELSTANAKIVELELKFASNDGFWKGVDSANEELKQRLSTANKKTEKLVEALEKAKTYIQDWASYADKYFQEKHGLEDDLAEIEQAIKEFRGEE